MLSRGGSPSSTPATAPLPAVASVGWSVGAALIGAVLVQVIGAAIDRPRPTDVLTGTHLLLDRTADFSFPSDHLTAMSAIAAGLILAAPRLRHRWYGWVAGGLTLLMAVVRVYVGAHYPGDVLGGIVLGTSVAVAFAPIGVRLVAWLVAQVTSTPLRPVVARAPVPGKPPG